MNERFGPSKFERLDQGTRTRFKQVENFRLAQVNNVTSEVEPKIRKIRTAISAAASLSLILLAACATIKANESKNVGDVDCNERTNSIDAALILQKTAGLIDTLACKMAGDVNADNRLNAVDAALILQYDARLINSFPAETVKKQLPTIDILDETFGGGELLASNLIWPQDIALSPVNGKIYFVAKSDNHGAAENIYEIDNKDVIRRFPGAGDPWGAMQQTEVAINQRDELFVYSRTWIDEYIRVYNTGTGEEIMEIVTPFPDSFGPDYHDNYQPVRSVAANPIDNKFYMSVWRDGPIISFDPETGFLERYTPENIGYRYSMCFDSSGAAYFGNGEYLDVVPAGGDGQIFEFENLHDVLSSIDSEYEAFGIKGLSYDNSQNRILMYGYAVNKGRVLPQRIILAVNPNTHIVSPVAVISSDSFLLIEGLDVDNNGNIYFTTTTWALPYSDDNGKVFKLIKN